MKHFTSLISQIFGKFANYEFPNLLQQYINKTYIKIFDINLDEFPNNYTSLNKLFTRELKTKRELESGFISPSDAKVSAKGEIKDSTAFQIKNMPYSTKSLLSSFTKDEKQIIENGSFLNLYLSPKDYHHYHVPTDMQILKAVHNPGKFYPVNFKFLRKKVNLFIENERVTLLCKTPENKHFFMVFVAALNVGEMIFKFDERLEKNINSQMPSIFTYESLSLKKGDELGYFKMGSTIVLLCEKDLFSPCINENDKVKFGSKIGD